jgi:Platelet-activating factor acetylhydrolase, isoform II
MRPLETLLSLANLLTFFVLAVPLPRVVPWMHHSAPIALAIAVAQVLVEGPRWQMVPAYALAGLFFLIWLLQTIAPVGGPAEKGRTNRLAVGLAVGLGVLGLAISIVLPIMLPVFRFPHPSGPYEIGTLTYHWVDADRPEVFTADPDDRRELMVQIWYPAEEDPSSPRAPYIQDAAAVTSAFARLFDVPEFLLGNLKYVTTNAIPSAPVAAPMADDEPGYPVLIYLEGLGAFRQMNTFQVEELVSHGYVVVAIDQPYTATDVVFPDGRQAEGLPIERTKPLARQSFLPAERAPTLNGRTFQEGIVPYLAQDVSFALDRLAVLNQADPNGILTGRLDLQRAGTFGFSLGGLAGSEACRLETRLRARLVMDAPMPTDVVQAGLRQPTMWITRDADTMRLERRKAGGWSELDIYEHQTTMRAVFESLPGYGYYVQVPEMFHLNLTDIPLLTPLAPRLGLSGPIGAQRAHSIINAYSLAFFDRHLKSQPATRFDGLRKQYPEVHFETRRP